MWHFTRVHSEFTLSTGASPPTHNSQSARVGLRSLKDRRGHKHRDALRPSPSLPTGTAGTALGTASDGQPASPSRHGLTHTHRSRSPVATRLSLPRLAGPCGGAARRGSALSCGAEGG